MDGEGAVLYGDVIGEYRAMSNSGFLRPIELVTEASPMSLAANVGNSEDPDDSPNNRSVGKSDTII